MSNRSVKHSRRRNTTLTKANDPDAVEPHVPDHPLAVWADPPGNHDLAQQGRQLAHALRLPYARDAHLLLIQTPDHLELRATRGEDQLIRGHGVYAQLDRIDTTSPAGARLRQPILKAIGYKRRDQPPTVLDFTAGFGEDTWLMAALGCTVHAIERSSVMAALLDDALRRAARVMPDAAARVTLTCADAMSLQLEADVVYLDPMYPGHDTRRTAPRKPLRLARLVVGEDTDAESLLHHALRCARQRVVVKRPLKAPRLCPSQLTPVAVHEGKSTRFDVYRPGI